MSGSPFHLPSSATADAGSLTLHLGDDTSLSFGDATYSDSGLRALSQTDGPRTTALGWSTGDAIVVGITQEEQVNTAPSFLLESATREVAENSAAGVAVGGPVTAVDTDTGDTLTYTLEGTDASSFAIVSTSGQIQTKAGVIYDHESQPEYSVTVKVDDGNGGTDTIAVTIDIADVDEPPSAPVTPTVSAVSGSSDSLLVEWAAPDNSGKPDIESYDLQYRKGTTGDFTDGPQDETVDQRHHRRAGRGLGLPGAGAGHQRRGRQRLVERGQRDHQRADPGAGCLLPYWARPWHLRYRWDTLVYGGFQRGGEGERHAAVGAGHRRRNRQADYASGSGTESLLFSYTVAEDDEDTEGIGVPADSLTLNGGAITATTAGGLAATLSLSNYSLRGVLVDGIRPIFESAETNEAGTRLFITFSEPISAVNPDAAGLAGGGVNVTLIEIDGAVVELDPSVDFAHDTTWTISLSLAAVRDLAGNANVAASNNAITNNVPEPNAPPEFTSAASFSVAENRTAVGTVRATDEDAADTVSYAVTGGADQAQFRSTRPAAS